MNRHRIVGWTLLLTLFASGAIAQTSSTTRAAAIRKCNDAFRTAMKKAAAISNATDRGTAEKTARTQRDTCLAGVPK